MLKSRYGRAALAVVAPLFAAILPAEVASAKDYAAALADLRRISGIIEQGKPADVLITNINIVDVCNEDTYPGSPAQAEAQTFPHYVAFFAQKKAPSLPTGPCKFWERMPERPVP